jgi:tripartite-type tricarboxylate transporter receptor subunit TctC
MSGETQITFTSVSETYPLVLAKRLRALGVTTTTRQRVLPDVPTIAEAGVPGYEFTTWHALVAPKATPPAVIALLNDRIRTLLRTPEQKERFAERALEVIASTPEELTAHLKSEAQKYGKVIKERGMKAD